LRVVKIDQDEIRYLYDESGKLIEREVKDLRTGNTEITSLHYLLSKPIIIKRDGNLFMLLTWDISGKLLRVRWQQVIGGTDFTHSLFPLYNGLGDIVRFVNDSKDLLISIKFDAWGNNRIVKNVGGLYELFGYKGGIWDKLSGYTLFGARWYDSKTGRWLSPDPLEIFESKRFENLVNLYKYSSNEPISRFDPSGLDPKAIDLTIIEDKKTLLAILKEHPRVEVKNIMDLPDGSKIVGFLEGGKLEITNYESGDKSYDYSEGTFISARFHKISLEKGQIIGIRGERHLPGPIGIAGGKIWNIVLGVVNIFSKETEEERYKRSEGTDNACDPTRG